MLDIVRTLIVAKLIGPYFTGLCTTLTIIPQIAQYLNLGTIEALTVFVPQYRANGMAQEALLLKNSVLNYTVITSSISVILIVLYAALLSPARPYVNQSIMLAASLIFLWEIKQFFVSNLAADGYFSKFSKVEFCFAFVATIFQIITVYYSREYGFWFGLIVANILVIWIAAHDYFKKNSVWISVTNLEITRKIIPLGIVMIIASVSYAPFIIISRVFLAGTVGVHEVGLFLISTMIISKISTIPYSISKVVLPHMSYAHGEKRCFPPVFDLFAKAQCYTLALSVITVLIGYFTLYPVVSFFLPQYLSGVPAAKMMLLAAIPYCLIDNANNVLLALQHKRSFIANHLVALVLQILTCGFLYMTGNVSSWDVSASFIFIFTCYAFLVNFKILQLRRQLSPAPVCV